MTALRCISSPLPPLWYGAASLRRESPGQYGNVACIRTNAMKFLPNYFAKGQLTKMFFLFPVRRARATRAHVCVHAQSASHPPLPPCGPRSPCACTEAAAGSGAPNAFEGQCASQLPPQPRR